MSNRLFSEPNSICNLFICLYVLVSVYIVARQIVLGYRYPQQLIAIDSNFETELEHTCAGLELHKRLLKLFLDDNMKLLCA
jgi:hypothetical protein